MGDEWGAGRYEDTAAELAPAAEAAVAALGLRGGERVLDVACGTGNAALVAARAGARVAGLDSSPRLVEVARERVPDGEFGVGDAAAMPFRDGEFDAAVSVFGVIFAHPGERAAAEIARVVRPGGRVAITSWPPRGPVVRAVVLRREAIARACGRPPGAPGPDWGDPATLERLLGRFGDVAVREELLPHGDATAEEIWERWERHHPMWIGARRVLEPAGEWDSLREESIAALRDGVAEAGPASPYLLAVLERR